MKKLFIGLFVLLGLFTLASCGEEKGETDLPDVPAAEDGEFDQNENEYIPDINMYIIGSHWTNGWNTAEVGANEKFVKDENSAGLDTKYVYTIEVTQEMLSWCGFKFIGTVGSWSPQWGMEDVDFTRSNQAFLDMVGDKNGDGKCDALDKHVFHEGEGNRSNVEVTLPGTYVIEYYPYNFASEKVEGVNLSCKFAIQFTPAA